MTRIVITGASGFVGQNLAIALRTKGTIDVIEVTRDTDLNAMAGTVVDHIVHLAGANRPKDDSGYVDDNVILTQQVLNTFKPAQPGGLFLFASTIRASDNSPYGQSKRSAEAIIREQAQGLGWQGLIWRLPNLFGKWCRPHYNSFVATFISQASQGTPLSVNDPSSSVDLLYIDDLLDMVVAALEQPKVLAAPVLVDKFPVHATTVGEVADFIETCARYHGTPWLAPFTQGLHKKLHATYLSVLGLEKRMFSTNSIASNTGSFREIYKKDGQGQVSVLTIEPGAVRGNHFHHTKCENFYLVTGEVTLSEHDIRGGAQTDTVITTGTSFWTQPGQVHTITNTGLSSAILIIWANEVFDPDAPDTYPPLGS